MTVIEKIEEQQKKLTEGSAPWCVGEQLKEICRREPGAAELVEREAEGEYLLPGDGSCLITF